MILEPANERRRGDGRARRRSVEPHDRAAEITIRTLAHDAASHRVLEKFDFAHPSQARDRDPRFALDALIDRFVLGALAWHARGMNG